MGKQDYHHGSLREACVREGMKQVARGAEAPSLREIARAAGVSPMAPYRHFKDKTELLAAVAQEGFERFRAALEKALVAAPRDPSRRLRALADAYVVFALENPGLVSLMFSRRFPSRKKNYPELDRSALASFAVLEDELGSRHLALGAWSMIHGFSDLASKGQLEALGIDAEAALQALVPLFSLTKGGPKA